MSAPPSKAVSFFPSLSARELTVVRGTPSASPYRLATFKSESIPDMHEISVSLPHVSTVDLPNALWPTSGHSTGMDLKVLLANIDRLKGKMSDHALSKKAGRLDAVRNLRRYAAGELKGTWTLDVLEDVASALDTSAWELLRPIGAMPKDAEFADFVGRIVDAKLAQPVLPERKRKNR